MKQLLLYIVLVIVAVSCQAQVELESDVECGSLRIIGLTIDTNAEDLINGKVSPKDSRTADQNDGLESFTQHVLDVTITDTQTGKVAEHYTNHTTMPATIVLRAGQYTISVRTANINSQLPLNEVVGFAQPQYSVTENISITPGQISSINLTAKQITAGVTVSYSDAFKEVYPCTKPGETYFTKIMTTYGAQIIFYKDELRAAHFVIPTADMILYYQISISRINASGDLLETIQGKEHPFDEAFMPVRQTCNYNLLLKVADQ